MNTRKLITLFLMLVSLTFYAQGESMKEKKEQIRVLKVAFFTTELNFTNDEAEKFWPLYNTFDENQFELRHQKMRAFSKRMSDGSLDKISEKEATQFLAQIEDTEEELFLLRRKFLQNVKTILPAVKIVKLKKAEEDFNRKLLQQYRHKSSKK